MNMPAGCQHWTPLWKKCHSVSATPKEDAWTAKIGMSKEQNLAKGKGSGLKNKG